MTFEMVKFVVSACEMDHFLRCTQDDRMLVILNAVKNLLLPAPKKPDRGYN